jgi:hypothetical protein
LTLPDTPIRHPPTAHVTVGPAKLASGRIIHDCRRTQVWFTVCYASPCIPIPPSAAAVTAANGHHFTRDYFNGPGSLWPRLWCREPGTYASWAQLFAMPIEGAGEART